MYLTSLVKVILAVEYIYLYSTKIKMSVMTWKLVLDTKGAASTPSRKKHLKLFRFREVDIIWSLAFRTLA